MEVHTRRLLGKNGLMKYVFICVNHRLSANGQLKNYMLKHKNM